MNCRRNRQLKAGAQDTSFMGKSATKQGRAVMEEPITKGVDESP